MDSQRTLTGDQNHPPSPPLTGRSQEKLTKNSQPESPRPGWGTQAGHLAGSLPAQGAACPEACLTGQAEPPRV